MYTLQTYNYYIRFRKVTLLTKTTSLNPRTFKTDNLLEEEGPVAVDNISVNPELLTPASANMGF